MGSRRSTIGVRDIYKDRDEPRSFFIVTEQACVHLVGMYEG